MSNEEKFKERLNSKLGEEQFPFDESNWPGMEAMLNADKKTRGGFYYLLPLLLLVGGLATYFWWPTNAKPSVKTTVAEQVSEKPATKTDEAAVVATVAEAPMKQTELKNVLLPKKAIVTKQVAEVLNVKPNEATPSVIVPNNNEPNMKLEENLPTVKSTGPQAMGSESPVVTSSPATNHLPMIDNTPVNETPVSVLAVPTGEISLPQTNTVESTPVTSVTVANTAVNAKAEPVNEKTLTIEQQMPAEENTALVTTVVKPSQVLTTVQSVSATASAEVVKDSVAGKTLPAENFTPVIVPEATSYLFFDLGGTYQLGYANGGNREANAFNPSFGLSLMNVVKKQWYFNLGIQYQSVRGLSFSKHVSKVTRYGLGEDNQVTVITPSTLHYLYMPIGISYRLGNKNIFSAQYRLGYLMNVSSKVETYNEHFNYTDNYKTYRTAGYTEGIALFDSQIALGYRRGVSKDLWVSADIYVGLTDIKNNTFFGSQVFERNSGIKISLMYQLFKK